MTERRITDGKSSPGYSDIKSNGGMDPRNEQNQTVSEEKSGGNVNYYVLDVKSPKRLIPYIAECEDIIEGLGMTFAEGCAFKALWRSCASRTLGKHKAGQDKEGIYDAEKIVYYGNRIVACRKRSEII